MGATDVTAGPPVVALVASAGGLEAITEVLGGLPADLPAAVLLLLHQAPDRPNHLAGILARTTELPVAAAAGGDRLEAGRALVVPPGEHLLVDHGGRTVLIPSGSPPPSRPSADLLLTTLALAVGARAIAVVLSGGGHDGATGATAIHALGGCVVATDEESSVVFSMPSATIRRDHAVDHVVALREIAPLVVELVGAGGSHAD